MSSTKDLHVGLVISAKDNTGAVLGKTRAGLESISRQLEVARNAFLAFHGVMLSAGRVGALTQLAEQVQQVNARLRLATGSMREFAEAQAASYRIAAQSGAGYEAVATLYGRLATAAKDYGLSQRQIADTTEATALALKVSGASASEAASVVQQFAQALGSGVLRGDEFNSIMENGGRLAKALADGLGLPVGRLRELAEQGLLTTDVMVKAIESQRGVLAAEVAAMPTTIGAALSQVRDEFGKTVDKINASTGATKGIAQAINAVAENMQSVLGGAAVAAVGALTIAVVRAAQAAIAFTKQKIAATAATAGLSTAAATATVAVRGLSTALTFIGGPLGGILTALTVGATAWTIWGDKAQAAADKARASAEAAREALARLEREQKYGTGDAATFREEIARLESRKAALAESARVTYRGRPSDALKAEIASVDANLQRYKAALASVEEKEKSTASAAYDTFGLKRREVDQYVAGFRAKLDPLKAALDELKQKFQDAKIPLDSKEYREAEATIRRAFARKAPAQARGAATEAETALMRARLDAEFALLKDGLARQQTALDAALEDRLVSVRNYYAQKTAIEQREIDAEIARKQHLMDAARRMQSDPRASESDRLRAKAQVADIEADLIVLNNRRADIEQANARRAAQAERDLREALAGVRDELAQITGQASDADRRAAIERGYRDLRVRLLAEGDTDGVSLVDRLIDVKAAQANLAILEGQWQQTVTRMRAAQESANIRRDAGTLTSSQAQAEIRAAAQEAESAMAALLPQMEALMAAFLPADQVAARLQILRNELATTGQTVDTLNTQVVGALQSSFANAFADMVSGTKTVADAFRSMARSILSSMASILANQAAESLFKGLKIPFLASAKGNVFLDAPALSAYSNTIVSKPTVFPFARGIGLMGEAGPEAIMPLRRGPDGRLGVEASGGGGTVNNVTVNVSIAGGQSSSGDAPNLVALGEMIANATRAILVDERRPGGLLAA